MKNRSKKKKVVWLVANDLWCVTAIGPPDLTAPNPNSPKRLVSKAGQNSPAIFGSSPVAKARAMVRAREVLAEKHGAIKSVKLRRCKVIVYE